MIRKKSKRRKENYTGLLVAITKNLSEDALPIPCSPTAISNRDRCALCNTITKTYCFGCRTRLCVKSNDDEEEFIVISYGHDRRLLVRVLCLMKHHEKGIDNNFEKLISND